MLTFYLLVNRKYNVNFQNKIWEGTNANVSNELFFLRFIAVGTTVGRQQSLHETIRRSFSLHATNCGLCHHGPPKNEIHFLDISHFCLRIIIVRETIYNSGYIVSEKFTVSVRMDSNM